MEGYKFVTSLLISGPV